MNKYLIVSIFGILASAFALWKSSKFADLDFIFLLTGLFGAVAGLAHVPRVSKVLSPIRNPLLLTFGLSFLAVAYINQIIQFLIK